MGRILATIEWNNIRNHLVACFWDVLLEIWVRKDHHTFLLLLSWPLALLWLVYCAVHTTTTTSGALPVGPVQSSPVQSSPGFNDGPVPHSLLYSTNITSTVVCGGDSPPCTIVQSRQKYYVCMEKQKKDFLGVFVVWVTSMSTKVDGGAPETSTFLPCTLGSEQQTANVHSANVYTVVSRKYTLPCA